MAERSVPIRRGRSSVVYRDTSSDGRVLARKVFHPDRVNRFLFHVLEGAPNPYSWCRAAIETAISRRDVVAPLLRYWFDGRVAAARAYGFSWNAEFGVYELRLQYVRGRHAPPRAAGNAGPDLLGELRHDVMLPLQRHLVEAGFDGLAWLAGLGNPGATSNFVLQPEDEGMPRRWVWVDLESSLPALFALDLAAQFRFYAPRAWRLRRPLFDDVDVAKLGNYMLAHARGLEEALGARGLHRLVESVKLLNDSQDEWKSLTRTERGIEAWTARDRITPSAAEYYRARPWRWSLLLLRKAGRATLRAGRRLVTRTPAALRRRAGGILRFGLSQRYRTHVSRRSVQRRVRSWRRRRFLDAASARRLRHEMRRYGEGEYVSDFGFHLLQQPFVKTVQWGVLPAAQWLGLVEGGWATFGVIAAGAIARTAYTGLRIVQRWWRRQPLPWVALVVGAVPVLGNLAYPAQLLVSGVGDRQGVARFLLHDWAAAIGRAIPLWGGRDTVTEHALTRLPDWLERETRAGAPRRPRPPERLRRGSAAEAREAVRS